MRVHLLEFRSYELESCHTTLNQKDEKFKSLPFDSSRFFVRASTTSPGSFHPLWGDFVTESLPILVSKFLK